jgi:D-alanyl-D-alanine carboxypeptidase
VRRTVRLPLTGAVVGVLAVVGWLAVAPLLGTAGIPDTRPGSSKDAVVVVVSTAPSASSGRLAAASPSARIPGPSARPSARATPHPTPSNPIATPGPTVLPGRPPPPSPTPRIGFPSATGVTVANLDARLARLRVKLGLPGLSVAILFDDGTTWTGTAGYADVKAKRLVTTDTGFAIASVSKTFTAALIMRLVEEGLLSLDESVRRYLPTLAIDKRITIRELLDHTSGLRDFFFHPKVDAALLAERARPWDATESLRYVGKAYFPPGTGWHYSNTNYLILGLVAEAVGGRPIADQLRTEFFEPLGLADTIYQGSELPSEPLAHGYRFTGPGTNLPAIDLSDGTGIVPFTSVVTAAGAAGSIATSAEDLARWGRALYGGSVLTPLSMFAMVSDVSHTAGYDPNVPYGLGVQSVVIDGHPTLGHSGRLLGFRAALRYLPDEGITIAVLTNQSRADPNLIVRALLDIATVPPPDCATCPVRR